MNTLKKIFLKIGNGFLTGIGFAFVLGIFYWCADLFFENKTENYDIYETGDSECRSFKKCGKDPGLNIKVFSERVTSDEFVLLGEVSNAGEIDWTSVSLKAELFDENEVFIEECTHHINEKVSRESKVNFKLSCSKCSDIQLTNYSSYKIKVIDASAY